MSVCGHSYFKITVVYLNIRNILKMLSMSVCRLSAFLSIRAIPRQSVQLFWKYPDSWTDFYRIFSER